MKLISLRLCEHDSNISYFDGYDLHYYKSERDTNIKHHAYNNLWEWRHKVKTLWDLDYNDIDEIALIFDPWQHKLPTNNENFFPAIEYDYFPSNSKVWRINHHYAHALSGWMEGNSDVQIIFDGYGDLDISWTVFKNENLIRQGFVGLDGSLGMSMGQAGLKLEIKSSSEHDIAGKLMALQSYGDYIPEFAEKLKHSLNINDIFDFNKWIEFKNDSLLANHTRLDWIRTIHVFIEQYLVNFFKKFANHSDRILYAGGVAQNVVWNTTLKNSFPNLITIPHCSDEGLSLGGIEWLRKKNSLPPFKLRNYPFCQSDEYAESIKENIDVVIDLLTEGKVVGWYQGNGEIGPRALGNRSILMDPRIVNGKEKINSLKNRENYRPFGASILKKEKDKWFENLPNNPYMTYIAKSKVNLPAIEHIDKTCRVQTVDESNGSFYDLLSKFHEKTGCPILLNTSFNIAGNPIISNTKDCYEYFIHSELDCLVLGDKIYIK